MANKTKTTSEVATEVEEVTVDGTVNESTETIVNAVEVDKVEDITTEDTQTDIEETDNVPERKEDQPEGDKSEEDESTQQDDISKAPTDICFTNKIIKVYAKPHTKSKQYAFTGTYIKTSVVVGNFHQIICNVKGLGKFVGYIIKN